MKAGYEADTKKKTVSYTLGGVTYELALTLNLIAEIQEKKGDLADALADATKSVRQLTELFVLIFNEAVDNWNEDHPDGQREPFTARSLGRRLTYLDVEELTAALFRMVGRSMPRTEEAGAEVTPEMRELLEAENLPEEPDGKNGKAGDA